MAVQGDESVPGGVLKRMNIVFDPTDPLDARFLSIYESCTAGVKLHLCKELLLAALPDPNDRSAEDLLLARAMRRAARLPRGRPPLGIRKEKAEAHSIGASSSSIVAAGPTPVAPAIPRQDEPAPPVVTVVQVATVPNSPTQAQRRSAAEFAALGGATTWHS